MSAEAERKGGFTVIDRYNAPEISLWRYCRQDNELVNKGDSRRTHLRVKHKLRITKGQWTDEMIRKYFRPPQTEEESERLEKSGGEKPLYEPVRQSLSRLFEKLGETYLEITAKKGPGPRLKEKFDDVSLHIINYENFFPDVMGYVKESEYSAPLIVCEIKEKELRLRDIMQARNYGVVFDAHFDALISPEPLPEEIKRWYLQKRTNLGIFYSYESVRIAQFDKSASKILGSSWIPSPPFKPNCPTCNTNQVGWDTKLKKFWCGTCKAHYEMPSE